MYVSGSRDGSIKMWDGISSKCVGTISQAHEGAEVGSVAFSRSGKVGKTQLLVSNIIMLSLLTILTPFSIFYHPELIRLSNSGSSPPFAVLLPTLERVRWENKNIEYKLYSIIPKTLLCFLMKQLHPSVVGMLAPRNANNCYHLVHLISCRLFCLPSLPILLNYQDTMEPFDAFLTHQARQHS